ncbi:MAG: RNA polymerase subunit sigma, partial [Pseudonocardiaceae bacterium]
MTGRPQRRLGPAVRTSAGGSATASPEELLARVARGDHTAFEDLYQQVMPPVFGIIRRVLRNPAQSE